MRVIFHFGPPKTGTSAIQKWFSTNYEWLLKQGIHYPKHSLDLNGVSSGNLRSVFSGSKANFEFSESLFSNEQQIAEQKNCHTVIFSSEFFFRSLAILAEKVPGALFVGYVRFGLETLQSSYNQSVKRHSRTTLFDPGNYTQSSLTFMSKMIASIGENRFILRPYSTSLFARNNLVSDFLDTVGIDAKNVSTAVGRVNSSYSIEAIEVKRWFNQLDLESLQDRLDLSLQGYGDGQPFSLLSDEEFETAKARYLLQLKHFLHQRNLDWSSDFYQQCEQLQNQNYKQQILSDIKFERILRGMIADQKLTYTALHTAYEQARLYQEKLENPQRVEILNKVVPYWVKLAFKLKTTLFSQQQRNNK
ncbi:hypothetical protein [Alteromonas lipotrueiana]|uniref:hypothetical protein n=1 Tax=Alteromonas lipotrueiana TaxID=2803815 RepID=UPI001C454202|nr:hypothetical protein [Alteromonas lipotrueiana]